ncbi:MAG TPA: YitT family protein [Candidatus Onthocola gallistercoris]|uniref:YitT family protein n=1 Tax=Candidatus Onthocola gallistercoris TaxID=2840876 RepID=A0A9D1KWB8_9FIRM|nr:YitT family protein [Candidatus Onthocola gallistercoris]
MKKSVKMFSSVKEWGMILVGAAIFSASINTFITPLGLFNGGFLGISQLLRELMLFLFPSIQGNVDLSGIIYFVLNIPVLILARKRLGGLFFAKTVFCVCCYSVLLAVIPVPTEAVLDDKIVSCLIGGLICGIGIGITLIAGASGGGEEVLGVILSQRRNLTVGNVAMIINVLVFGTCLIVYDMTTVVYSALFAAFTYLAMDKVHLQNITTSMVIITKKDGMEQEIFRHVQRGVTEWTGRGGYSKEDARILLTVLSKKEALYLRSFLQEYDPDCFIITSENVEVHGNFVKRV